MDDDFASRFYEAHGRFRKAVGLAKFVLRRAAQVPFGGRYDAVFVQREAAILGPALFETALTRLWRVPMIFDIDDAVWSFDSAGSRHPVIARMLKSPEKTNELLTQSTEVIAASDYLATYAKQYTSRVTTLPTVVSCDKWLPLACRSDGDFADDGELPTIGWIGTHSTATHLDLVVPALRALAHSGERFQVRLVGASRTLDVGEGIKVSSVEWQAATELHEFQNIDIGIAPLADNAWTRGKGGFKQIQFMTVGVPLVSSPVGGAREFLRHDENALLARTTAEWTEGLSRLLRDRALRARLSRAGRALTTQKLSIEAQATTLVNVVERAIRSQHTRGH